MTDGDCFTLALSHSSHMGLFLSTTITLICLSIPLTVAVLIPGNVKFEKSYLNNVILLGHSLKEGTLSSKLDLFHLPMLASLLELITFVTIIAN